MIGKAVPLVLIPRYTTYVGESTFTTAPLRVSDYAMAYFTFWRGPLTGSGLGGTFKADFQLSHDGEVWVDAITQITSVDGYDDLEITLSRRLLRVKIELAVTTGNTVGITCWATGLLERRIEGEGPK